MIQCACKRIIAGYCRVSTPEQNIEMQKHEILKSFSDHIDEWYIDIGISGINKDRPEYRRLLEDCSKGKIEKIVVYKLDRWGRSLVEIMNSLEQLSKWNVQFISIKDNIDLSTACGKLMLHIISAFAEFERNIIRERIIAGIQAAKKRGVHCGRPKGSKDKKKRKRKKM